LALRQRDFLDLAFPQEREELAQRDFDRPRRHQPPLDDEQHGQRDEQVEERELRLLLDREFHFRTQKSCYRKAPSVSNLAPEQEFSTGVHADGPNGPYGVGLIAMWCAVLGIRRGSKGAL